MLTRKACLVVALQEAQKRGLVREGADLSAAADFIRDSIHDAMLRHTLYRTDPEAVDAHLRGVTDIFTEAVKPVTEEIPKRGRKIYCRCRWVSLLQQLIGGSQLDIIQDLGANRAASKNHCALVTPKLSRRAKDGYRRSYRRPQ